MFYIFFFFQAEDGIRDLTVTGVQTCALPILDGARLGQPHLRAARHRAHEASGGAIREAVRVRVVVEAHDLRHVAEIGRASCRERGWRSVLVVGWKKIGYNNTTNAERIGSDTT